jgi:chromosomal replication initiation ATPase DnaA
MRKGDVRSSQAHPTDLDAMQSTAILEPSVGVPVLRPRISEVLFQHRERGFDSIACVQSNVRAVELAVRFASGVNPFVAIIGPSGWGKTHLMTAAARQWSLDPSNSAIRYTTALSYSADPKLRAYNGPLIIDDAQDLISRTRPRIELQWAIERRVKAGRPTMLSFTETKLTRAIRGTMHQYREWVVAIIKAPTLAERESIVRKLADFESIHLSDPLVKAMVSKIEGNGRTLQGALTRLKTVSHHWPDSTATIKALGILAPVRSASDWDLREHIATVAHQLSAEEREHAVPFDLAVYMMLKVALLPESEIARFFRIEPARVYAYATRFAEQVARDEHTAQVLERFINRVVTSLN